MRELIDFIKAGLSNDDGSPSFARQAMAGVLYFIIWWETYLICKSQAWVDIPPNWLILVLAIWTVAKGAETVAKAITAYQPVKGATDAVPTGTSTASGTVADPQP